MTLDKLIQFQKDLERIKDPRERRGFLDSFYTRLKQTSLSDAQVAEIGKASELLQKYGFEPHARRLMIEAGIGFLCSMDLCRFEDENVYEALPYVNKIADHMESSKSELAIKFAGYLIDYFVVQVVLMTPNDCKPSTLPLSKEMAQAKAIASFVPEGYRRKSRFVVLPENGRRVPGEFELEGHMVYPGYTRDGIMEIGKKGAEKWEKGPVTLEKAPEGVPPHATYERLRDSPLRGIMLITYRVPK